ncbi:MAG: hypothetical protein U0232_08190 [Thermomicrobiales bacterium]
MGSPLADFFIHSIDQGMLSISIPIRLYPEQATILTNYAGADLYYVLIAGDTILGYGMLRGWDAGYEDCQALVLRFTHSIVVRAWANYAHAIPSLCSTLERCDADPIEGVS